MRVVGVVLALLALAGCGGREDDDSTTVVAAVYALAWAAERVGGDSIHVVNLISAGGEPHDVELSPRDVETIRDADLVIYAGGGFQPAVEDAVEDRHGSSLDVLGAGEDPHVWLDPIRFAAAVGRIAERLGRADAVAGLVGELRHLDEEYRRGLERCARRTLVTSHASFGHLVMRYDLTALSLAGRSPEAEPGPRAIEQVVEAVRESGATTVFTEPLVSDRLAQTVAREAGVEVADLDPIEGLSEERLSAGEDYLSVMRDNLAALREALGCT